MVVVYAEYVLYGCRKFHILQFVINIIHFPLPKLFVSFKEFTIPSGMLSQNMGINWGWEEAGINPPKLPVCVSISVGELLLHSSAV
jgi:hypothetical protein